jgi:hypothetical protein
MNINNHLQKYQVIFNFFIFYYIVSYNSTFNNKKKDAWLAAILALVYAILMVFGVIAAIYCR